MRLDYDSSKQISTTKLTIDITVLTLCSLRIKRKGILVGMCRITIEMLSKYYFMVLTLLRIAALPLQSLSTLLFRLTFG
jgi:hypothetical protein